MRIQHVVTAFPMCVQFVESFLVLSRADMLVAVFALVFASSA